MIYCAELTVNLTCSETAQSDLRHHYSAVITCLLFSGICKVQPSDFVSPFSSCWLKNLTGGRAQWGGSRHRERKALASSWRYIPNILVFWQSPLYTIHFSLAARCEAGWYTGTFNILRALATNKIKWLWVVVVFRPDMKAIWLHAWVMFGYKMLKSVRECVRVLVSNLSSFNRLCLSQRIEHIAEKQSKIWRDEPANWVATFWVLLPQTSWESAANQHPRCISWPNKKLESYTGTDNLSLRKMATGLS